MSQTNISLSGIAELARTGLGKIEAWLEISRQRRTLATLDDRMLKDIGISRASAKFEARRPFWDLPYKEPRKSRDEKCVELQQEPQACCPSYSACA